MRSAIRSRASASASGRRARSGSGQRVHGWASSSRSARKSVQSPSQAASRWRYSAKPDCSPAEPPARKAACARRSSGSFHASEPAKSARRVSSGRGQRASSSSSSASSISRSGEISSVFPANAESPLYGDPPAPVATSGSSCHSVCPASASQSTKRYACAPRSPTPSPGSDVGCSSIPLRRSPVTRIVPCAKGAAGGSARCVKDRSNRNVRTGCAC